METPANKENFTWDGFDQVRRLTGRALHARTFGACRTRLFRDVFLPPAFSRHDPLTPTPRSLAYHP
jgi:hypothetical protein